MTSRYRSSEAEKIDWLVTNAALWADAIHWELAPGGRWSLAPARHRLIVSVMKRDGLIAPTTYALDVKLNRYIRYQGADSSAHKDGRFFYLGWEHA